MTAPHPFQFHQIKLNEFIGVAYKEKPIEDLISTKEGEYFSKFCSG